MGLLSVFSLFSFFLLLLSPLSFSVLLVCVATVRDNAVSEQDSMAFGRYQ
jgi:hypothetical protein